MKAMVYTKYGSPDVIEVKEVDKPTPKDNEVLIKVHAATITAADSMFRKGDQFAARLFTGLMKPKRTTLGWDLAGEIEAVGKDVTLFKVGEQVFGVTTDFGTHAEYICLPESAALAVKPAHITSEEAVALAGAALTALPFLRDEGKIQRGQKILINGASGSVGTVAVQLAKYFGAEVTGVCSRRNLELVNSLGADQVIDYTKEDFTKSGETYDIIFDTVGKSSFSRCKGSLKQNGLYLTTVITPAILPQMFWTSKMSRKKAIIAFTGLRAPSEMIKDLHFLNQLIEAGKIKGLIDRSYPLEQIAEAYKYVDQGHKRGNVVIRNGA